MPSWLKNLMRAVLLAGALGVGAALAYCGAIVANGNFHTVVPGQLYRSAQLGKAELRQAIDAHGIHSVLNLRGANPQAAWYVDELAVARQRGVVHYDLAVSAQEPLTEAQTQAVLYVLRTAPKPILVHCQSGADRTGLAIALYRYAVQGKSAAEAQAELSLAYGHFPYFANKTIAMDATLQRYLATH